MEEGYYWLEFKNKKKFGDGMFLGYHLGHGGWYLYGDSDMWREEDFIVGPKLKERS